MCGPRSKISDRLSSRTRLVFLLGRSSPDLLLSGWCFPSAPNSCSTLAALTLIDFRLHHFSPQSLLVFVSSAALLQIPWAAALPDDLLQRTSFRCRVLRTLSPFFSTPPPVPFLVCTDVARAPANNNCHSRCVCLVSRNFFFTHHCSSGKSS